MNEIIILYMNFGAISSKRPYIPKLDNIMINDGITNIETIKGIELFLKVNIDNNINVVMIILSISKLFDVMLL
jgi:hypothetical protein